MTLPASGVLSVRAINTELGKKANAAFALGGTSERSLAAVPTGQIKFSDFYGKTQGQPTPDIDYPDPNTITETVVYPGTATVAWATLGIYSDGQILVVDGVPTTAIPALWFQDTLPPPGYKVLFSLQSQSNAGGLGSAFNIYNDPNWVDLATVSNALCYVNIYSNVAITTPTWVQATYVVYISDGTTVVASFTMTFKAELT